MFTRTRSTGRHWMLLVLNVANKSVSVLNSIDDEVNSQLYFDLFQ